MRYPPAVTTVGLRLDRTDSPGWKYTPEGDKTRYATLEEENKALRLRNAEQAIEIDMLKKASAYFASLRK